MLLEIWLRIWKNNNNNNNNFFPYYILVRLTYNLPHLDAQRVWKSISVQEITVLANINAILSFPVLLNLREYDGIWEQQEKKLAFIEHD